VYSENVRLVEALGAAYGFASFFYWQPSVFTKPSRTAWEANEAHRYRDGGGFFLQTTAALGKNRWLTARASFHDLSHVFAEYTDVIFIDYVHLSERGNAIISSRMATDLQRLFRAEHPVGLQPLSHVRNPATLRSDLAGRVS